MNFEVCGLLEKDFGATIASVDLPKMTLRNIVELTSQSANKKGEKDTSSTATTSVYCLALVNLDLGLQCCRLKRMMNSRVRRHVPLRAVQLM